MTRSDSNDIQILHFGASSTGGANIAALRLHKALKALGADSTFYIGDGRDSEQGIKPMYQQHRFLARTCASIHASLWARRWRADGFIVGNGWFRPTAAPKMSD